MDDMNKDDMSKKEDFNFEWLPGFREMMVCQNDSQTQSLLPPEQLQQEEQKYWKDYEYSNAADGCSGSMDCCGCLT